jgi:hypothetical protein
LKDEVHGSVDSISLLAPVAERPRVAEYPGPSRAPLAGANREFPDWDPTPFVRSLRSIQVGKKKLILASDRHHELYDLASDPEERRNLVSSRPEMVRPLDAELTEWIARQGEPIDRAKAVENLSEEQVEALRSLGYF